VVSDKCACSIMPIARLRSLITLGDLPKDRPIFGILSGDCITTDDAINFLFLTLRLIVFCCCGVSDHCEKYSRRAWAQ
jgi:hypothetical protein